MPRKKLPRESSETALEENARPKSLQERCDLFLDVLGKTGHVAEALKATGLKMDAVLYRKRKNPDFAAGWDLALESAGRARDYLVFLDVFAKTGNQTEALKLSGMRRADLLAKKRDDPDFAEAFNEALAISNDALEAEARRRAVEGVEELVIQSGSPVYHLDAKGNILCDELGEPIPIKKKVYSDKLLETMLKANMPEKYRENVKVDHAVTGGVLLLAGKAPSQDEWEKRMEQKRLASQGKVIEHAPTE